MRRKTAPEGKKKVKKILEGEEESNRNWASQAAKRSRKDHVGSNTHREQPYKSDSTQQSVVKRRKGQKVFMQKDARQDKNEKGKGRETEGSQVLGRERHKRERKVAAGASQLKNTEPQKRHQNDHDKEKTLESKIVLQVHRKMSQEKKESM